MVTKFTDPLPFANSCPPNEVVILLFHGVCPTADYGLRNYTGKHIAINSFASILRGMKSWGAPVSMDDVQRHVSGSAGLPSRSFAVTFDDGFWNNLTVAAPLLDDLRIPGTFYVTSDLMATNGMTWVDRIEAAVATTSLTKVVSPFPLGGSCPIGTQEEKVRFMRNVRTTVKGSPDVDADYFADELVSVLVGDGPVETVEVLDRKLASDDLRYLASNSLFTVGGHGKTHRILAYLPSGEMIDEVRDSITSISAASRRPVIHYSYPEGFPTSYSDGLISELALHGVRTGVTTEPGSNGASTDPFRLRRFFVA